MADHEYAMETNEDISVSLALWRFSTLVWTYGDKHYPKDCLSACGYLMIIPLLTTYYTVSTVPCAMARATARIAAPARELERAPPSRRSSAPSLVRDSDYPSPLPAGVATAC